MLVKYEGTTDLVFKPFFLRTSVRTHAIWPMLLYKAWAKVKRNYDGMIYDNVDLGSPNEALYALTGVPIEHLSLPGS